MSDKTSRFLFAAVLLFAACYAHGQNVRWDLGNPGGTGAATTSGAGLPFYVALPNVDLNWCNHPANAIPCTNFANTYPSLSSVSPCPTNAQVVLQGSNTCVATGDALGNVGVYTLPNTVCGGLTCYDYTLTVNGQTFGPYLWTSGGVGGGGVISGLTAGVIPQAGSPTSIINSNPQADNGVTTANTFTYAGSGGLNLPSDGVHAASTQWHGGTTLPLSLGSNVFGFIGPNSASFPSYFFQPNATAPTAGQVLTAGTPSGGVIPLNYATPSTGGGNPVLENCAPDQTGNSFYNVTSLTNFFLGSWSFVFNTSTYITCMIFIPTAQTGATIVLDIAANDGTAGHTANFQTCDQVINSGTINVGALTCAANQTFTTTATAYNRVTLTFNVQSTLANNSILVVKIATSTTGTAPTANLLVYPHFIL